MSSTPFVVLTSDGRIGLCYPPMGYVWPTDKTLDRLYERLTALGLLLEDGDDELVPELGGAIVTKGEAQRLAANIARVRRTVELWQEDGIIGGES